MPTVHDTLVTAAVIIALLLSYFLPAFIAFSRGHHYRYIILVLNIAAGWTGLLWLAALIWSIWPRPK